MIPARPRMTTACLFLQANARGAPVGQTKYHATAETGRGIRKSVAYKKRLTKVRAGLRFCFDPL